jgi:hypothetical protein
MSHILLQSGYLKKEGKLKTVGIFLEKLPLFPWSEMYRKYGPLVKETVGGKTILHVFNLGKELLSLPLVLQIFLRHFKN